MPETLRRAYLAEKPKAPFKNFIGLILIALLIITVFIIVGAERKESEEWLRSPKVGDVYEVKEEPELYTLMRVADIKGDSIGLQLNAYTIEKQSQLNKIRNLHGDDYEKNIYYYSSSELYTMFQKRNILKVIRK